MAIPTFNGKFHYINYKTKYMNIPKFSWNSLITIKGTRWEVFGQRILHQSLVYTRKPGSFLAPWLICGHSGLILFVPVTSSQSLTSSGWSASLRTSWSSTELGTCSRTLCVPSCPTQELASKWTSRLTPSNRGSGMWQKYHREIQWNTEISQWNTDWWSQKYIRGRGGGFYLYR